MSSSIRSGRSSLTAARASAPVCATAATVNPGVRSTKPRWTLATMKSSSTTSTRITTFSSFVPRSAFVRRLASAPHSGFAGVSPQSRRRGASLHSRRVLQYPWDVCGEGRAVDGRRPAAAHADRTGERQPEAARTGRGRLGGEALAEDLVGLDRRDALARVPDGDQDLAAEVAHADLDPAAGARRAGLVGYASANPAPAAADRAGLVGYASANPAPAGADRAGLVGYASANPAPAGADRVDGVVHEVAGHGHQVRGERLVDRPDLRVGPDPQLDTALGGQAGLRHQQRGECRVGDAGGHLAQQPLVALAGPVDVADDLLVFAQLDEAGNRVQPVGELVGLGAQRVGGVAAEVELAAQRGQLGTVAQRGDRTDPPATHYHRHLVEHEDPVVAQDHLVGPGDLAGQHVERAWLQALGRQRATDRVGSQPEQPDRLVVDEGDPIGGVRADDALLDAVQHRLPVLDEAGDLGRLEAERLALDPPGEQQRAGDPQEPAEQEVHQQAGCGAREQPGEGRIGEADGDEAEDRAVLLVEDRDVRGEGLAAVVEDA